MKGLRQATPLVNDEFIRYQPKFLCIQVQAIIDLSEDDKFLCQTRYLDRSLNICRLTGSVTDTGFWSYFLKNMESAIGGSFRCPFKKQTFVIKNYSMALPSFTLFRDHFVCATVKFFAKAAGTKKFVNHLTTTIHMSFLKV